MDCSLDLFARNVPDTTWPMKAPEVLCLDKSPGVRFAAKQAVLSWSLTRPGFVRADTAVWLEVSDADPPIDIAPVDLPRAGLTWADYGEAAQLMTLRDVTKNHPPNGNAATPLLSASRPLTLPMPAVGADTPRLGQSGTMAGGRAWMAEQTCTSQGSQER
ncbi:hypothetical protein EN41_20730 [Agrobacterium tumefaciens]|nr:hypothetical protein [Agrobacterium fabrum]KEY54312.1 hypothetical protein EN41_20730 [Agrobacterium tumefaciens]QQN14444.1 hypothetical protein EML540_24145 [Agrobacterium fabrum]WEN04403.1 hypothetical protein P0M24_24210 [Agrobacterium fabrum]WJK77955.1 hypothetical protein QOV31_004839 [Agrobacterium fabrum]CAD0216936.1 hypothetical protein AGTUEHA105_LOCUS4865 [Agrobacterium tumefaciens]